MSALRFALKGGWLFLLVGALLPAPRPALRAQAGRFAYITHYDEVGYAGCGDEWTLPDTAACSWDLPCGARVSLVDGYTVRCNGRGGGLGDGALGGVPSRIDIWSPGNYGIDAAYPGLQPIEVTP